MLCYARCWRDYRLNLWRMVINITFVCGSDFEKKRKRKQGFFADNPTKADAKLKETWPRPARTRPRPQPARGRLPSPFSTRSAAPCLAGTKRSTGGSSRRSLTTTSRSSSRRARAAAAADARVQTRRRPRDISVRVVPTPRRRPSPSTTHVASICPPHVDTWLLMMFWFSSQRCVLTYRPAPGPAAPARDGGAALSLSHRE